MRLQRLISLGAMLSLVFVANRVNAQSATGSETPVRPATSAGFLVLPQKNAAGGESFQTVPYQPQPGDLLLYDYTNKLHHFVFKLARSGAPLHAAMVIAREDGTPALLELTGPTVVGAKVCIVEVEPRLANYPGSVMVRRIRQPLSPEQSRDLTAFAQAQVGKSFAFHRMLLQGTPFNCRSGLRNAVFGHTYLDRNRWFCSELVVAAGTTAGVFNPQVMFANTTYPRDLAFDDRRDISEMYHPIAFWIAQQEYFEVANRPVEVKK